MTKETTPAKVFFNSACPVCAAGIARQRNEMQACGLALDWIDVHQSPSAVAEVGATLEAVRERLYVKDEHGKLHVGAEAFAELLSRTPSQRWLGHSARWPMVNRLIHALYNVFARQLYRWNLRKKHW